MNTFRSTAFAVALGLAAMAGVAKADISFSGSGSSGILVGPDESWTFNYDGGAAQTGYLNDWGSPGVAAGTTAYDEAQTAFGMSITFSGGGTIDAASIIVGNSSACAGATQGGTTFCNISSGNDIFQAFQTTPDTIEFLSQSPVNNLTAGSTYFVNVFFDGATPTSFTGAWLTSFSSTPVSSAPEPSTWALMILGLGGVGAALRQGGRRVGLQLKDSLQT